ncbi:hypothetical protein IF2G_04244 [Cordyceps javanica]|nr:hypothetical protein IF2G_04244 [Cordyceps javanica]
MAASIQGLRPAQSKEKVWVGWAGWAGWAAAGRWPLAGQAGFTPLPSGRQSRERMVPICQPFFFFFFFSFYPDSGRCH